jgi:hypothetical protein
MKMDKTEEYTKPFSPIISDSVALTGQTLYERGEWLDYLEIRIMLEFLQSYCHTMSITFKD